MRLRSIAVGMAVGALVPAIAFAGTSVFQSSFTATAASNATGMALGDYDHDGALDVVTCNAGTGGNQLTVMIGFLACAGGSNNGNVCTQSSDCAGAMCLQDGTLNLAASIDLMSFPAGLVQGKFDNDQIDDLIIAKANDDSIQFVKGTGDSNFFMPSVNLLPAGHSPVGLAAADLDGDGHLDLVAANEGSSDTSPGAVTVLKGDGMGGFTLVEQNDPTKPGMSIDSLPTDIGTSEVAIGKIDANPTLDVLALNTRANTISVFNSDGHFALTPHGSIPTMGAPQDMVLVDLNGDSKLDLVLAATNNDAVTVQLGNGDGTFGTAQSYPVGTAPTRVSVADMNGDHILDIVSANSRSGDMTVLLATAPGVFGPGRTFVADAEPQTVGLGDYTGDGLLDVVSATQGGDSPTVAVLRNLGNGALHAVEDLAAGASPSGLAVADVDNDGWPDLVVAGQGGTVMVFPSGPSGLRLPAELNVGGRPVAVAAADLNGDGIPDIATVDGQNGGISVIMSQGGGHYAAPAVYLNPTGQGAGGIAVGDFNGDGRPDLAVSLVAADRHCQGGTHPGNSCSQDIDCGTGGICTAPGMASVLLQQANGSFGTFKSTGVDETPIGIAAIDANCDGKDDLLVANLASSTVSVLRSNGDGSFALVQTLPQTVVGDDPIAIAVADFNGDGVPDFAVTNTVAPQSAPNVHVFAGNCTGPFAQVPGFGQVRAGSLASALVARDFTGDGKVDLAVVSQTDNSVVLLVGNGDGTLQPLGSDGVSRMPIAVAAGDFNLDGLYDAVSANSDPSANNVSLLTNCVRELYCDPFGNPGPPGKAALRGDGNGDGLRSAADLVAVAAEVMDGDGFQVEGISGGSFSASAGVDANGDGRVDGQDRVAVAHRIFGGA
jgi:hypothetical protein